MSDIVSEHPDDKSGDDTTDPARRRTTSGSSDDKSSIASSDDRSEYFEDPFLDNPESQEWVEPPTPPGTPPPEVLRKELSVETTTQLFHTCKLRLTCPPRWKRLFLSAAEQYEKRLHEQRELLYMAVASDDVEMVANLKSQVLPNLFDWWGYDLDLVVRASTRFRPEVLKHLPDLFGEPYPGYKNVLAYRTAMDAIPAEGSKESVLEMQRGTVLINFFRNTLESSIEINVDQPHGLKDILNEASNGPWQDNPNVICIGVNYGAPHGAYAGWRAVHFIAASFAAVKSAVPALELLFTANADANARDAAGCSALHVAASQGNLNVVTTLLDHGAPLEAEDFFGCSALNLAARARYYPVVRAMVKWLLPKKAGDDLFYTAADRIAEHCSLSSGLKLFKAASAGNIETVKELARLEPPDTADVNYADPSGRRPVHVAAGNISNENVACDMLKVLVGLKADINARDVNNETPLHVAARQGRAIACKVLLLLHAHPSMLDLGNRTPLMLAAAGPTERRCPPEYSGVRTNSATRWSIIQDIIDWNGRGEAPGPEARKVKGAVADKVNELLGHKTRNYVQYDDVKNKRRGSVVEDEEDEHAEEEADAEEAEENSDDDDDKKYKTMNDIIVARATALCDLGFDDQKIIESDGRINRGDRIQIFNHVFQPDRNFKPTFEGEQAPLIPNEVRCKLLWNHLTGPMLVMEQQGILPPRPSALLSYLLRSMLGRKGAAFGILASHAYDATKFLQWSEIESAFKTKSLRERCELLKKIGFEGPKPKLARWAGSVWAKDSYPRDPNNAPWGAFDFLSLEDEDHPPLVMLQKHDKYNVVKKSAGQAFKGNAMSIFQSVPEGSLPTGMMPPTSCVDSLMLSNRVYVNEHGGIRKQVEVRARQIGESLLAPLLMEYMQEMETSGVASENELRLDILEYLRVQLLPPRDCYVFVNEPRRPYKDQWEDVVERAIWLLCTKPEPDLLTFKAGKVSSDSSRRKLKGAISAVRTAIGMNTSKNAYLKAHKEEVAASVDQKSLTEHQPVMPRQSLEEIIEGAPPGDYGQFSLATPDDRRWLMKCQSTRAFIELKRVGAFSTLIDYSGLVSLLAHGGLQDFHGRFWRAVFGLWLWGRAKLLKPILEVEIRRRLSESFQVIGPKVRPKADMLNISELALKANAELKKMASEPPWLEKNGDDYLSSLLDGKKSPRKPLDHNAGKPDGGVKPPTGIALYEGFTDILTAQVVCNDAKAMKKAIDALTGPPSRNVLKRKSQHEMRASVAMDHKNRPAHIYMIVQGREGRTRFVANHIKNDFCEDQRTVIPLTASVTLSGTVGWVPLSYGPSLEQNVKIELILRPTRQARWLADYIGLKPSDMPDPKKQAKPKSRSSV